MIKFIIIDNDLKYHNIYESIINKLMFNNDINYEIERYNKYTPELGKTISDRSIFKIYLSETVLPGSKNGLDIAREIRTKDWDSEILFITNHDKLFETVFRKGLKVFSFIEKYYNLEERLEIDLSKILSRNFDKKKFFLSNCSQDLQIYLKDILYLYCDTSTRKVMIVTNQNIFHLNTTLKEALQKCDNRFKQVHRACIVNTDEVNLYNWNKGYFKLKNGKEVLLCSKNYRKNVENV